MLRLQTFFQTLNSGRIRKRSGYRFRHKLRERRRHSIIQKQQQPPHRAHATDEPTAVIEARIVLYFTVFV
ncbi:hypothetical protein HanIR_Chr10g0494681 [Helianthus annuus]|nr:hypothetical protein HanIR_Chr10g0494681 [Helianthus annuus]